MKLMRLFVIGCLTVVLGGCAANEDAPGDVFWSTDKTIRVVNGGPSLPHRQLQALAGQAAREYAALRAVLGEDVGRVTVRVHDSGIARHFPPATIRIPTRLLRKSTVITAHEITHLLSQGWASQVLKEGLASYLQARFGEQRGWPNYRRTLHGAARYWLRESESVHGLADAERTLGNGLSAPTKTRLVAYNLAGSWVRWLLEEKLAGDLDRFMREIYRTENYEAATDLPLLQLWAEWREFLMRIR